MANANVRSKKNDKSPRRNKAVQRMQFKSSRPLKSSLRSSNAQPSVGRRVSFNFRVEHLSPPLSTAESNSSSSSHFSPIFVSSSHVSPPNVWIMPTLTPELDEDVTMTQLDSVVKSLEAATIDDSHANENGSNVPLPPSSMNVPDEVGKSAPSLLSLMQRREVKPLMTFYDEIHTDGIPFETLKILEGLPSSYYLKEMLAMERRIDKAIASRQSRMEYVISQQTSGYKTRWRIFMTYTFRTNPLGKLMFYLRVEAKEQFVDGQPQYNPDDFREIRLHFGELIEKMNIHFITGTSNEMEDVTWNPSLGSNADGFNVERPFFGDCTAKISIYMKNAPIILPSSLNALLGFPKPFENDITEAFLLYCHSNGLYCGVEHKIICDANLRTAFEVDEMPITNVFRRCIFPKCRSSEPITHSFRISLSKGPEFNYLSAFHIEMESNNPNYSARYGLHRINLLHKKVGSIDTQMEGLCEKYHESDFRINQLSAFIDYPAEAVQNYESVKSNLEGGSTTLPKLWDNENVEHAIHLYCRQKLDQRKNVFGGHIEVDRRQSEHELRKKRRGKAAADRQEQKEEGDAIPYPFDVIQID